MSEQPMGFAIVGCGVIAPWHARAIAELPAARLVTVVDEVEELAAKRGAEFGVRVCPDVHVDGYVGVGHQQVGATQQMLRSHGEHSGTAGTGTDEGDPSDGLADTAHLPTRFPLRPSDPVGAALG